jgi:hypothetical protein
VRLALVAEGKYQPIMDVVLSLTLAKGFLPIFLVIQCNNIVHFALKDNFYASYVHFYCFVCLNSLMRAKSFVSHE